MTSSLPVPFLNKVHAKWETIESNETTFTTILRREYLLVTDWSIKFTVLYPRIKTLLFNEIYYLGQCFMNFNLP